MQIEGAPSQEKKKLEGATQMGINGYEKKHKGTQNHQQTRTDCLGGLKKE